MVKIILIIAVLVIVFGGVSLVKKTIESKKCKHCEGKGYWRDLRDEPNHCKVCNGSGKS